VNPLAERIAALIASQGPVSVAHYMALVNDAYYATRDPLGRDFITAPEISQVFGELMGLWIVQAWADQGRPREKRLVELGPGRGTLMADALRAARVAPEFRDGLEIVLVEASPALRAQQEQRVPGARWAQGFGETLADKPLFLIANEFFDALPVRQFVRTAKGWRERMVALDARGALAFALSPVPVPESYLPAGRSDAPDGAVCEISPAAEALTAQIARSIAAQGGAALIVDYGYERPGFGETLQAVAGHSFTAILDDPGESDLSAHVDFAALARAAAEASVHGPVTQGEMLEDLGIAARFARLAQANPGAADALQSQLTRLTRADEMGTLFKALAILPKHAPRPPGF